MNFLVKKAISPSNISIPPPTISRFPAPYLPLPVPSTPNSAPSTPDSAPSIPVPPPHPCPPPLISVDLKWETHINKICNRANSTLSFIRRNFKNVTKIQTICLHFTSSFCLRLLCHHLGHISPKGY